MRIALDGQCFKKDGDSRIRGVGRYSLEMVNSVIKASISDFINLLVHEKMDVPIPEGSNFSKVRLPFDGPSSKPFNKELMKFALTLGNYDLIHVLSPMEPGHIAVQVTDSIPQSTRLVATLYDLIPLVFSDHYLADPTMKKAYMESLEIYRKADHILSLSHASKADLIEYLGIPDERVTVLPPVRSPLAASTPETNRWSADRLTRYILYTGGDDFRKNLDGVVLALCDLAARGVHDVFVKIACKVSDDTRQRVLGGSEETWC